MVERLRIGPYEFKVVPLFGGPLLEVSGEGDAVAQLLNHAIAGTVADLSTAIETETEGSDEISYVLRAADPADDSELRKAWLLRTGEDRGPGEIARVGQAGTTITTPMSWSSLQRGLADLRELQANWRPEPGPWLFVQPVLRPFVTPDDLEVIKKLESEAAAIDELSAEAEVGDEPPSLVARRRSFLAACRSAGIFSTAHGNIIEQWLRNWSAQRLLAHRNAANEIHQWGLATDSEDPLDWTITLDYVRLRLWPPGDDGKAWAISGVKLLDLSETGDQGAVLESVGKSVVRMWWRRDGVRPALFAIARD